MSNEDYEYLDLMVEMSSSDWCVDCDNKHICKIDGNEPNPYAAMKNSCVMISKIMESMYNEAISVREG